MAAETLCLFEDEGYKNLLPLVYSRPTYDLRCGALTLRERLALQFPDYLLAAISRTYLQRVYGWGQDPLYLLGESTPITFVNGRLLDTSWLDTLFNEQLETAVVCGETLLAARVSPALASSIYCYLLRQDTQSALAELRRFASVSQLTTPLLRYPWDLINANGAQIVRDAAYLTGRLLPFEGSQQVVVYGRDNVFVSPEAQIDGPVVLDGRDGPVLIDAAKIEPFSFIQGPIYIGKGALIASARLRGETSIGPVCRVGGEVEASIMQSYSNKHHDGFLGHSFLGEWVNIGAMTTTSDLKNTYGNIKMILEDGSQVDSGTIKLGAFLADHVKLGIGMHMNGGTVIGTGSNLFGVHSTPKTVPPFIWGGEVFREYRIERMIDVARKVMSRRKVELSGNYAAMLFDVFSATRLARGRVTGEAPHQLREPQIERQLEQAEAALVQTE